MNRIALLIGIVSVAGTASAAGPKSKIHYSSIAGIIKAECVSCHNATRHPEKVDLSNYTALMASGEKHPTVTPGDPKNSTLFTYVDGERNPRMPFNRKPLSSAEIAKIKKWIAAGAKS